MRTCDAALGRKFERRSIGARDVLSKALDGDFREDLTKKKVGVPTEMRIARPKPFAVLSRRDDSPAEESEWTVDEIVASSDLVRGAPPRVGGTADDGGVTGRDVPAPIEKVDATGNNETWPEEWDPWTDHDEGASAEKDEWLSAGEPGTKKGDAGAHREDHGPKKKDLCPETKGAGATEKWIARRRGTAYSTAPSAYTGELERELEYFVEPEEAFTRDEIE